MWTPGQHRSPKNRNPLGEPILQSMSPQLLGLQDHATDPDDMLRNVTKKIERNGNLSDSEAIWHCIKNSERQLFEDFKIEREFRNLSRNVIGRQVTELNSAVEYHNFIVGFLKFRSIGISVDTQMT